MIFNDDGRLDAPEHLAALLREQGMAADEIADMLPALQRLPDWHAPAPTPATQHALLTKLIARQSLATRPAPILRQPATIASRELGWRAHIQIALRQPRLIHRSLWAGAAVGIFMATSMALLRWSFFGLTQPGTTLEFFLPVIAAVSMAFIYGPESDTGLEVTQATPVSPRYIAACRLLALGSYELLLSLLATGVVAYAHHIGFGELALLWLGPMALLSACGLLLSLLTGPIVAAIGLCIGWLAQFVQFTGIDLTSRATAPTWLSQPVVFALAAVVLFVALLYLPRHERRMGAGG
jgi:hypothetical protein